jgi:hypothetical protein
MTKISPLPQAIDRELADLAAAVYDQSIQQVGRWRRDFDAAVSVIPAGIGPTSKPDPTSGFKAAVFTDGDKAVLAFAGSERETRDWLTNFAQGLGMDTAQYRQASAFAQECKVQYGDKLMLTGHSLGGGLAAVASATTNTPCVTFNPAGVHRKTLERAGVDPDGFREAVEAGLVRKYVVKGEILDRVNRLPLVPKAPGVQIVLEDPGKAWSFNKHSMTTMQRSMDAANPSYVTVAESALPYSDPKQAAMAAAFRKEPAGKAVQSFPGLANAYKMLEAAEAKASGMPQASKDRLMDAMRENLAKRIERGEKIPAPKQAQQLAVAVAQAGPER